MVGIDGLGSVLGSVLRTNRGGDIVHLWGRGVRRGSSLPLLKPTVHILGTWCLEKAERRIMVFRLTTMMEIHKVFDKLEWFFHGMLNIVHGTLHQYCNHHKTSMTGMNNVRGCPFPKEKTKIKSEIYN